MNNGKRDADYISNANGISEYTNEYNQDVKRQKITSNSVASKNIAVTVAAVAAAASTSASNMILSEAGPRVIRILVTEVKYPVTTQVLSDIGKSFGRVIRIVTFNRNGQLQALLEFGSPGEASAAIRALDQREIYAGCNKLHVQISQMERLHVKYNDEKSYDYTNPNLRPAPSSHMARNPATSSGYGGAAAAANPITNSYYDHGSTTTNSYYDDITIASSSNKPTATTTTATTTTTTPTESSSTHNLAITTNSTTTTPSDNASTAKEASQVIESVPTTITPTVVTAKEITCGKSEDEESSKKDDDNNDISTSSVTTTTTPTTTNSTSLTDETQNENPASIEASKV